MRPSCDTLLRAGSRAGSIRRWPVLLGLWPNLRTSTAKAARAERQEKVRIADAVGEYMSGWEVSRVWLDYLPHYDLVEIKTDQFDECVRVPKDVARQGPPEKQPLPLRRVV
jgi:hypothetical protein